MYVTVNGARLFFDVEGLGLVPDGPRMRQRPTVLLLHGGPGFDHTMYKPAFSALAEVAQVIYYDHRGQGRSEMRSEGAPDTLNLAQWGDDVKGLCDALGIEKPIVKNGFVKVPETPGLGVDLNEQVIRDHLIKDSGYFDPTPEWNQERANDRLWS